jgi:SAM-dependent methyltransferase
MVDRDRWDAAHAAGESPTLRALRRQHLWTALPDGIEPTTVWPAWPLERVATELELSEGEVLLDMACGRGDLGSWLSRHTNTQLIGVEPSAVGRRVAEQAAPDARIVDGHFTDIPLDDAAVDAAVVIDALQLAEDRVAALRELARVLRPGRHLVVLGPDARAEAQDADFSAAGLRIEQQLETDGWRDRFHAFCAALHDREEAIRAEAGPATAEILLSIPVDEILRTGWHGLVASRRAER